MTTSSLSLDAAIAAIHNGGIIAYPTEGVYGLGCDPFNERSVLRLCALKQRPVSKGLILVASQWQHIEPLIDASRLASSLLSQLKQNWPAATTYLFPCSTQTPQWIRGDHEQVAIRLSAHSSIQKLCNALGHALVSTSANLSGQPTLCSANAIHRAFNSNISGVLSGHLGGNDSPSRIIDTLTGQLIRP